jgi:RNA polymerase-interacting CarD/CdnL/TRCF family regulator
MRRLDYARKVRSARGHARNAAEVVMALAQVARERHRLEQERRGLELRLRRIDSRLTQIAGTETKLVPAIQHAMQRQGAQAVALPGTARARVDRLGEVTLQY